MSTESIKKTEAPHSVTKFNQLYHTRRTNNSETPQSHIPCANINQCSKILLCKQLFIALSFIVVFSAKQYPNSQITGLDISFDAVGQAKENARAFPNTAFVVSDASDMPKEWTAKFDYVTIFEALHDQARPDLVNLLNDA